MVGWWFQTLFLLVVGVVFDVVVVAATIVVVVIFVDDVVHPLPLFAYDPDCSLHPLLQTTECPIHHSADQFLHYPAHGI